MDAAPRLIHMMFFPWGKDQKLRADQETFDRKPFESMARYAPDFEVRLWTYARAREFCAANYPAIWEGIHRLARPIMMLDVLRWLVVYHFGGVFWQYYQVPLAAMDRMLPSPGRQAKVFTEFVLSPEECRRLAAEPIRNGEPEESIRVLNQVFSAVPRHPFIKATLDLIVERTSTLTPKRDYDILFISANAAVSTAYDRFGKNDPTVELVSRPDTRAMFKTQYLGSWRTDDAAKRPAGPTAVSAVARLARAARAAVKSVPCLAGAYYRWVEPHPHETAFAERPPARRDDGGGEWAGAIPALAAEFGIRSVLEYPCGPAAASRLAAWNGLTYIGGDPVRETVKRIGPAGAGAVRFMNAMYSRLPRADLVVCRNFFVRLPYRDALAALKRLRASGARYLLATTFPLLNANWDGALGDERPLNMTLLPFAFPEPLRVLPDPCPDGRTDRSLGLWTLADTRQSTIEHT
ncbi:MAG TPA: hypothetical protein P5567_03455 [Kiritimatiellia bacterium]|nr:hypothetical protein [Kiritimatiellia bacterium]HRZ11492.1 hypothetical protein [Kiritimatiellia bacterium]HSA16957.1 hypothetical protein [Kiritimatiellia bacterium]